MIKRITFSHKKSDVWSVECMTVYQEYYEPAVSEKCPMCFHSVINLKDLSGLQDWCLSQLVECGRNTARVMEFI